MKNTIIFMLLVVGLAIGVFFLGVWGQTETAQTPKNPVEKTKMPDVSPEVREKAFGLLNEALTESESLKSASSKFQMQLEIADLLWEKDETKARKVFQSFISETTKESCLCELLTEENIKKIANRDSKTALQARYFLPGGGTMDLIFEIFLEQYPEEALAKSKESLTNDFAGNFFRQDIYNYADKRKGILDRLALIYAQNSKNGADFAGAIFAKLKENKLNVHYTDFNANFANRTNMSISSNIYRESNYATNIRANINTNKSANYSLTNSNAYSNVKVNNVDFSKVSEFFEMALASEEPKQKDQTPMLTESELSELAKLMVNSLIITGKFNSYQIQGIYNGLKKYAPAEMAKLEKTISPEQRKEIKEPRQTFPALPPSDSPVTEKLPIPPNETPPEKEEREFVDYVRYISKITSHCNIEEDAITFARLSNKKKYPDLVKYFEDYMPTAMAKTGNVKELRKYLKKETDNAEKMELLSLAADALTAQNDKNDLAELLKEANITVPKQYKTTTEFKVMMNYAKILSAASPAQSFEFLENLLNNANEIINSAAVVAEFSEHDSQDKGEFRFSKMQEQIAKNSPLTIGMIKKLAHFDFERTKKLADKFTRPEARLFIRWHIVNSLLNKNAPVEEAKFYEVEICG